jgi:hypothetical protein
MMHRLVVLSLALAFSYIPARGQAVVTPPPASSTSNNSLYYNKMHWAGTWSATVTYNSQDVVSVGGVGYVSLVPLNLNNPPSTSLQWWVPLPNSPPFGSLGNFVSLVPPPTSGGPYYQDSFRVQRGNCPIGREFGNSTVAVTQTVVGCTDIPATTYMPGAGGLAAGVTGIAATGTAGYNAVGVYAQGMVTTNSSGISAWGANFSVGNCEFANACTDTHGFANSNLYGLEIDVNNFTPAAANITGLFLNGGSASARAATNNDAILIGSMGAFASPPVRWMNALKTSDGGADVGMYLGLANATGASGSQPIQFSSYDGTTRRIAIMRTDGGGNLAISPGAGAILSLEDSGGNGALSVLPNGTTPYVSVNHLIEVGGAGGPRITTGSGAPVGGCITGSIYLRTDASTTPLYVCASTAWASVTIP